MTCVNPSKRQLKTETTGEGKDRVVVPINEIRKAVTVVTPATAFSPAVEEPIVFDPATETLQIVDDEIVVVPRPPRVPVLGAVKKYTFHKRLKALGKWEAFNDEIKKTQEIKDLYDNSHELDINDHDVIELSPLIKIAVGVTDEEYNSLFEV